MIPSDTHQCFKDPTIHLLTECIFRYLVSKLHIPVFVLCDADVHGVDIMLQYKYGSRTTAVNNPHLTLPCLHWLGVFPSEIEELNIKEEFLIEMTETDTVRVRSFRSSSIPLLRKMTAVN